MRLQLFIASFFFSFLFTTLVAQASYTSYFTGDTADVVSTTYTGGIVLAGGGQDSDAAMRWMLNRAGGGDVLVLRASGSDGYNDYFFSQLGVAVNSVETIKFNAIAAATDPYVIRRIQEAEVLFFAGGDQSKYVEYWRGTPVAEAINSLINVKGITVGGTSAGMAVLGGIYYAPSGPSLVSMEALSNPYHLNTVGISGLPFLEISLLENVITDTHFESRNRQGRTITLLARATELRGQRSFAIAANDATAICVDELGTARIFGEFPDFDDYAFFLQPGCSNSDFGPENLTAGQPLTWNREGKAVSVYRIPGTFEGTNTFDLTTFLDGTGGSWEYWSVNSGVLAIEANGNPPENCAPSNSVNPLFANFLLYPTVTTGTVKLIGDLPPLKSIELVDLNGCSLQRYSNDQYSFDLSTQPAGVYWLRLQALNGASHVMKVIRM